MKIITKSFFYSLIASLFFLTACQKENVTNAVGDPLNPPTADAGAPQAITANIASLSGTGTTENGHIVGYLWSLVSGPNLPEILTPSSPTTTVTGMVTGTYLFQFAVIDSMGLTGVDTTSVTVTSLPIHTLVLQPANNIANEINFAEHGGAEASSHDIDIDPGSWTWGGLSLTTRGAFKFDYSSIPAGSTILSAKLTLYSNPTPINGDLVNANSGSNNAFYIRRIVDSWSGSTATWATQPAVASSDELLIPHTTSSFLDLVDIDVTTMVLNMWPSNNNGFMMRLQDETPYNIRQFASSVHPDATKHPKLVITYQ